MAEATTHRNGGAGAEVSGRSGASGTTLQHQERKKRPRSVLYVWHDSTVSWSPLNTSEGNCKEWGVRWAVCTEAANVSASCRLSQRGTFLGISEVLGTKAATGFLTESLIVASSPKDSVKGSHAVCFSIWVSEAPPVRQVQMLRWLHISLKPSHLHQLQHWPHSIQWLKDSIPTISHGYNYIILALDSQPPTIPIQCCFSFFSNLCIGLWKPHSFSPWNPSSATNSLCDFGTVTYLLWASAASSIKLG